MPFSLRFIRFIRVGGVVSVVGIGRGGVSSRVKGAVFGVLAAPFLMQPENSV